jgi:multiple sugar transport system permease protein/raffinose/stachyose/melibiose transport system permease protein
MIIYLIFTVYPLLSSVYYSFHKIQPVGPGEINYTFVGLENYKALLDDKTFMEKAIPNTLLFAAVAPTLEMLIATTLAFFIYFRVPFHRFYRTAWFMPRLVSGVIVGFVFRWIFNVDWGLLNVALRAIGLDALALNWLGRTDTPIWVVIFVHVWSVFGHSFILLLAGLTTINEELIEAAYIDGATRLQSISRVLLPLLRPTLVTVAILSFMGKMRAFNVVWVLTQGRPLHFSETVSTWVQTRAFNYATLDLGYPSAMAVVWFGVVMIGVGLLTRGLRRRVEEY